jgi:hypothetical protein
MPHSERVARTCATVTTKLYTDRELAGLPMTVEIIGKLRSSASSQAAQLRKELTCMVRNNDGAVGLDFDAAVRASTVSIYPLDDAKKIPMYYDRPGTSDAFDSVDLARAVIDGERKSENVDLARGLVRFVQSQNKTGRFCSDPELLGPVFDLLLSSLEDKDSSFLEKSIATLSGVAARSVE